MRQVKSTLQQNHDRTKKGKKSTTRVFYHHPQNKKKNENGPMADEETPEDSSNTSDRFSKEALVPTLSPRHWTICYNSRKSKGRIVVCAGIKHTTKAPSGQTKLLRCWLKYQQAVKRCVRMFFWWCRGEKGKGPVCEEGGREVASFQFTAQTSQSILTQTLGVRTGWRLRTADWRFLSTEDFFLNTSSHWWEGKGRGISVCFGGPAGERGDGGVLALCNNQIPL